MAKKTKEKKNSLEAELKAELTLKYNQFLVLIITDADELVYGGLNQIRKLIYDMNMILNEIVKLRIKMQKFAQLDAKKN